MGNNINPINGLEPTTGLISGSLDEVKKIQEEFMKTLIFDVNGINACGIGKKDGKFCIHVYAANKKALKDAKLPDNFQGVEIVQKVGGVIRPL